MGLLLHGMWDLPGPGIEPVSSALTDTFPATGPPEKSYSVFFFFFNSNNFLPILVKVKSLSRVQLCDPMDCRLQGSSIYGILQARVLEWVAVSFSTCPY